MPCAPDPSRNPFSHATLVLRALSSTALLSIILFIDETRLSKPFPTLHYGSSRGTGAGSALPGCAALTPSLPRHGGRSFQSAAGRGLCSSLPAPPPPLPSSFLPSAPSLSPSLPPPVRPERPERPAGRGNERAPRPCSPSERVPGVPAAPADPACCGCAAGEAPWPIGHGRRSPSRAGKWGRARPPRRLRLRGDCERRGGPGSAPCSRLAGRGGVPAPAPLGARRRRAGGCAAPGALGAWRWLARQSSSRAGPAGREGPHRYPGASPEPARHRQRPPRLPGAGLARGPGGCRSAGGVNCPVRPCSEEGNMKTCRVG